MSTGGDHNASDILPPPRTRADRVEMLLAPWMRLLWFVFLVILGVVLPHSTQRSMGEHLAMVEPLFPWLGLAWAFFFLEFAVLAVLHGRSRAARAHLWAFTGAALPPLRLSVHPAFAPDFAWIPLKGWRKVDKKLVRELENSLAFPMVLVALMILPILGLEFLWSDALTNRVWLAVTVEIALVFIWLVFAIEFFTMLSVHDEKIRYCKEHWLNLAIVLLPLIAFLRVLRVVHLGRISQLERMTRIYRLRGTLMRIMRALVAVDVLFRMHNRLADKRVAQLRRKLAAVEEEAEDIRERIAELEAELAARQASGESAAEARD